MIQQVFEQLNSAMSASIGLALAAAFAWGVLSILLSPCHLASIPLVVGFVNGQGKVTTGRAFALASLFSLGNEITNSTRVGVLFRQDTRGCDFWANRNRLENNRIVNSGGENGVAVDIQGQTKQTVIVGNEIRETREPSNRIGIRIAEEAGDVQLAKNTIEGFATAVQDLRSA